MYLCVDTFTFNLSLIRLQVGEHALSAMRWGHERVNWNGWRLIRDQDFASMGWTLLTLHRGYEQCGQNGERPYNDKNIASMDRERI